MNAFRQVWLVIECDDQHHDAPVVVRSLVRLEGSWLLHNSQDEDDTLHADTPVSDDTTWNEVRGMGDAVRIKRHIRCSCGAELQAAAVADVLFDRLVDGGVSAITLRRLNALVSNWR